MYLNISLLLANHTLTVGWAGWRCRKRWWRRRVHQRGRWSHGEETGRRGRDVLQVRASFFLLFIVQSIRIDPFFSCSSTFPLCICFVFTCASYYKRRKEQEQLAALKQHHQEEIDHHKKEIERLQREIDRHKGKIRKLKHDDWVPLVVRGSVTLLTVPATHPYSDFCVTCVTWPVMNVWMNVL